MRFYTNAYYYRKKNAILLREVADGQRLLPREVSYGPRMFALSRRSSDTGYKTIYGSDVEPVDFADVASAVGTLRDDPNEPARTRPTHGMDKWVFSFLNDEYPGRVEHDADAVVTAILDIEVASDGSFPTPEEAAQPVTAISLKTRDRMHTFGLYPFTPDEPDVAYYMCRDEEDLLKKFLQVWRETSPDVMTGWNIEGFDLPYLTNRIARVLSDKWARMLSPWGLLEKRKINRRPDSQTGNQPKTVDEFRYYPVGVAILDYMKLFQNKNLVPQPYESYSLNSICVEELGEAKLDYSQYESLQDLYKKDYETFIKYNIRDVRLIEKLEQKRGLIAMVLALAYRAKVNYEDVLMSSRPWDAMTHNYLLERGIVVPLKSGSKRDRLLLGGYVKMVEPGMYDWVVSFDVTSEYPNTIIGCNISPETFLGKIDELDIAYLLADVGEDGQDDAEHYSKLMAWHQDLLNGRLDPYRQMAIDNDAIITANGCLYSRKKQGFIPALLSEFFDERQKYKGMAQDYEKQGNKTLASRYDTLQGAAKVSLNACYGCLSNEYYRWFDINLAESITSTGQMTIKWAERAINQYLNGVLGTGNVDYVIGVDTDSTYVNFGPLVKRVFGGPTDSARVIKFLDEVCKEKIKPLLDAAFQELATYLNVPENRIVMKREIIAERGIWTAKKNYILSVWDKEGIRYPEPKLEVKGIKAAKPSTPARCREKIKEAFRLMIRGERDSVMELVDSFEREFSALPFEDVAFTRSISGLQKYSLSPTGVPIQVRGALLYNALLESHGLKQVAPIHDGDRARFCYLKLPNPTGSHVITAPHGLPKQLELDQYLDKKTQFEKAFREPVFSIMRAIGWHTEKPSALGDLFG